MYITIRDRPGAGTAPPRDRRPVGRVVLVLGTVSLLTDISSESVAAILPLYLTGVLGFTALAYGFVDGLHQGVSALVRLGGGWLADRTNKPKWVAFVGYAISAVARIFLICTSGLGGIAGVVTADRIGKGIRTAPRDAMISSATPTAHLGRAFGVHRMLDTIGAAAGPLLAFTILWLIPDGYTTVLLTSAAFALTGVALLGLLGPDQPAHAEAPTGTPSPPPFRWRDLADARLRPLLLVAGVLGLLTIGDGFIYLALLDRGGFAATWFPLLYVGTNVAYLLTAVPLGRLGDRVGRAKVLVLGHLALVGAYVCAVLSVPVWVGTVAAVVCLGLFYAATDGATAALAGRLVPVQARSSGIAAAQTVVALSRMLASFSFGFLWLWQGPATALLVVTGLLVVAVGIALGQVRRLDRTLEAS